MRNIKSPYWDSAFVYGDQAADSFYEFTIFLAGLIPGLGDVIGGIDAMSAIEKNHNVLVLLDDLQEKISAYEPEVESMATQSGTKLYFVGKIYKDAVDNKTPPVLRVRPIGIGNSLEHALVKAISISKVGTDSSLDAINPLRPRSIESHPEMRLAHGIYITVDLIIKDGVRKLKISANNDAHSEYSGAIYKAQLISPDTVLQNSHSTDPLDDLRDSYLRVRNVPLALEDMETANLMAQMYRRNLEGINRIHLLKKKYIAAAKAAEGSKIISDIVGIVDIGLKVANYVTIVNEQEALSSQRENAKESFRELTSEISTLADRISSVEAAISKLPIKEPNQITFMKVITNLFLINNFKRTMIDQHRTFNEFLDDGFSGGESVDIPLREALPEI